MVTILRRRCLCTHSYVRYTARIHTRAHTLRLLWSDAVSFRPVSMKEKRQQQHRPKWRELFPAGTRARTLSPLLTYTDDVDCRILGCYVRTRYFVVYTLVAQPKHSYRPSVSRSSSSPLDDIALFFALLLLCCFFVVVFFRIFFIRLSYTCSSGSQAQLQWKLVYVCVSVRTSTLFVSSHNASNRYLFVIRVFCIIPVLAPRFPRFSSCTVVHTRCGRLLFRCSVQRIFRSAFYV